MTFALTIKENSATVAQRTNKHLARNSHLYIFSNFKMLGFIENN